MIRALLVLLLLVAGVLVVALVRDRHRRRAQQMAGLRSAFLHGMPLAAPVRPPTLREVVVRGGLLRFRVPGTWVEDNADGDVMTFRDRSSDGRVLRLELGTTSTPEAADAQGLARAFGASLPEKERSVEPLPNGNVLMKWLEDSREAGRDLAVYRWRLGRPLSPPEVRVAVFTLAVEIERAKDVVVQSDLASIEREIRSAELS